MLFICMMGNKIAKTINKIIPPPKIITKGSSKDKTVDILLSISPYMYCATFSNINVKFPDLYPLESSCKNKEGKILASLSD